MLLIKKNHTANSAIKKNSSKALIVNTKITNVKEDAKTSLKIVESEDDSFDEKAPVEYSDVEQNFIS